jgi:hypothetical protein
MPAGDAMLLCFIRCRSPGKSDMEEDENLCHFSPLTASKE